VIDADNHGLSLCDLRFNARANATVKRVSGLQFDANTELVAEAQRGRLQVFADLSVGEDPLRRG
jgi:hypothetical protein